MIDAEMIRTLIRKALDMRAFSYVPYSHFAVGAAVLMSDGSIYTGCNIENAAYGPTVCAERTAIFKAVSEGKRGLLAVAVAGAPEGTVPAEICPPCGTCRQVMKEFAVPDFRAILAADEAHYEVYTMDELLPAGFTL